MKVSYFAFMAAAMWACCGCSSEKSGDKPVADAKIGIRTSILDRSEMRTPSLDSNGSGSFADGTTSRCLFPTEPTACSISITRRASRSSTGRM